MQRYQLRVKPELDRETGYGALAPTPTATATATATATTNSKPAVTTARTCLKLPVLVGTCGWTDETLLRCGRFYPASVKNAVDRLRHYSRIWPTVGACHAPDCRATVLRVGCGAARPRTHGNCPLLRLCTSMGDVSAQGVPAVVCIIQAIGCWHALVRVLVVVLAAVMD